MELVGKCGEELSVEERNLLSVAYKNAVGSRRAAWRIITSVEQKEKSKGNEDQAGFAKEYCGKAEAALQKIWDTSLVKTQAAYYRYTAEFTDGEKKSIAAEKARQAYQEAHDGGEGLGRHAPVPLDEVRWLPADTAKNHQPQTTKEQKSRA